jgi:hypothetical protein
VSTKIFIFGYQFLQLSHETVKYAVKSNILFGDFLSLTTNSIQMRNVLLFFGCFFSVVCFSQTKLISHKSHSGNDTAFKVAIEENLFDIDNSNLGVAPNRYERNAVLDSVIYVSDDKVILVTSQFCIESDRENYKILSSKKWSAGRETVFHHKLFSKKHALDSIKDVLKTQYSFRNDIDKVIFVGYDNEAETTKRKKKTLIPVSGFNFPSKPLLILLLTLLSSLVAFFVWKTSNFKSLASR